MFWSKRSNGNSALVTITGKSQESDFAARHHPRLPTFSFVEICSEDGDLLMEATVREISKRGAQLRFKTSKWLPERFFVRSTTNQFSKMATVKWISGPSVGVEFDEDVNIKKGPPDAEERIRVVASHLAGKPLRS
jgi:hypothetical protein